MKVKGSKSDVTHVRMYRQGLGDCFLITFRDSQGGPVHMLLDCGVWDNDSQTKKQMAKVVKDINTYCGGHLHVLVCTHQHWDHNSGFLQHAEVFGEMKIDNVWLAWTEDPSDALARSLQREYEAKRKNLAAAVHALQPIDAAFATRLAELALGGGKTADPAGAMRWIRDLGKKGTKVRYCSPGNILSIPHCDSARALVLGPPRARKALGKNLPTGKEQREGDVYHLSMANAHADAALMAAVRQLNAGSEDMSVQERMIHEASQPFDRVHRVDPDKETGIQLIDKSYRGSAWRRIDNDWLNSLSQLALWMDSSTNNTSLVLAFELQPSRKILLFVADAQVGNWKSWQEVKFAKPYDKTSMDDILARTVLYKVGHHGSHNATLRRDGLEKMTDEELVAMIPVNGKSVKKKGWKMPFEPMLKALQKKTGGRIIRADDGVLPADHADAKYKAFQKRCKTTETYIECAFGH